MDLHEPVTSSIIAQTLGITTTRVNGLVSDGILPATEGKPRKFDLPDTVQAYVRYKSGANDPGKEASKDLEAQKMEADVAYKAAKAKQEQLTLEELEGKMHRAEDVQAAFEQLVYGTRSMLIALPGRLAVDVHAATNAEEAADIIRGQVDEILNSLAEFEYDPDFFSERVRDRMGWMGIIDRYTGSQAKQPGRNKGKLSKTKAAK